MCIYIYIYICIFVCLFYVFILYRLCVYIYIHTYICVCMLNPKSRDSCSGGKLLARLDRAWQHEDVVAQVRELEGFRASGFWRNWVAVHIASGPGSKEQGERRDKSASEQERTSDKQNSRGGVDGGYRQ